MKPTLYTDIIDLSKTDFDLGINTSRRIIHLSSEIDESSTMEFDLKLQAIFNLSGDDKSPVTLQISSPGGEVFSLLGFIDMLNATPVKVNTLAVGFAWSGGALITALATGERAMTKNSYLMFHGLQIGGLDGNLTQINEEMQRFSIVNEQLINMLATKSNHPVSFWKKQFKKDFYLNAQHALKLGVIDKIV